jgi:hypothetical protein
MCAPPTTACRTAHKRAARQENLQNVLQNTMVQLGGLFAVSQACLLGIFVPQKCPEIIGCIDFGDKNGDGRVPEDCLWSPWFTYPANVPDGHLCGMKGTAQSAPCCFCDALCGEGRDADTAARTRARATENVDWANFTQRNKNVFLFNAITLCIMLAAQSYFWKREVWMITHLSEDNSVAYNNLPDEISAYGEFEDAVAGYNRGAFYFALAVGSSVVINFIISTDFLINGDEVYNYNLGSRTITGLLTVRARAVRVLLCVSWRVVRQAEWAFVCLCGTEHDACEHQSAGLPLLRATILRKRMVRCLGAQAVPPASLAATTNAQRCSRAGACGARARTGPFPCSPWCRCRTTSWTTRTRRASSKRCRPWRSSWCEQSCTRVHDAMLGRGEGLARWRWREGLAGQRC